MKPIYLSVKFLALAVALTLNGCSYLHTRYGETCNSRAYIQRDLEQFISARFHSKAPVRLAVIPFTVPANLTAKRNTPGLQNELAWKVHQELASKNRLPIVEVFNRQDWPQKAEEFFTGNFGAISFSREAGYDLVLVGYLENFKSLDTMVAHTKIIEVESGMTVWYGKTTAHSRRPDFNQIESRLWLEDKRPDLIYSGPLVDDLARCIVNGVTSEPI